MPMKRLLTAFVLWGFASGAYASDILLTWTAPTEREDGTAIAQLDRYDIHHTVNNVVQDLIQVEANAVDFTLADAAQGTHTFLIRAVEGGVTGKYSDPAQASIIQAQIGPITVTIEVK
jgi:hypothetical protein